MSRVRYLPAPARVPTRLRRYLVELLDFFEGLDELHNLAARDGGVDVVERAHLAGDVVEPGLQLLVARHARERLGAREELGWTAGKGRHKARRQGRVSDSGASLLRRLGRHVQSSSMRSLASFL